MKKEATAGVSGRIVDWKRKCNEIRRKGKLRVGDGVWSGPQKTCTSNSVFLTEWIWCSVKIFNHKSHVFVLCIYLRGESNTASSFLKCCTWVLVKFCMKCWREVWSLLILNASCCLVMVICIICSLKFLRVLRLK